ncbi:MAG: YARHG domain-containing protein [Coriobacteriales bacterium]|nr:YARHG domain-containing protein [Coriobacteriales bacterium]
MKYCTECGAEIIEGSAFCIECGTSIEPDNIPNTPLGAGNFPAQPSAMPPNQGTQPGFVYPDQTAPIPKVNQPNYVPPAPVQEIPQTQSSSKANGTAILIVCIIAVVLLAVVTVLFIYPGVLLDTINPQNASNTNAESSSSYASDSSNGSSNSSSNSSTSSSNNTNSNKYMFPDTNSRYYSESELAKYSDWDLYIGRNEIYARHGRGFNKDSLQNYFDSQSWYSKKYSPSDFPDSVLNEYEKANAELFLAVEKDRGSSYLPNY